MRPLPALLILVACSAERAERVSDIESAFMPDQMIASFAAANPDDVRLLRATVPTNAEPRTETNLWADTSRRGDTTFYSRGRVITSVAVHTDSTWAVLPPVIMGIPYGPSQLPPDSLCTLGYTGTTLPVIPSTVLRDLERTRECGARTFTQIRRAKLKDSSGHLSVQAAQAEIDRWPWSGLCTRVKDSTIIAFHIGDDVTAAEWGPALQATRLAQWDSIAGLVQQKCPGAPTVIRARPAQLESRAKWQWLTTAWAQYPGPLPRSGSPERFFTSEVASAKRQRLGLVAGVNLLAGGCGPADRNRCLPDVPGSTLKGPGADFYQLSASEFIYYKTVAMSDPYVCASVDWSWGPNFRSDFHERAEIRSAAKALGLMARQRPRTSCIQR
jgi:hypothetical protein